MSEYKTCEELNAKLSQLGDDMTHEGSIDCKNPSRYNSMNEAGASVLVRLKPIDNPSPLYTILDDTLQVKSLSSNNFEKQFNFSSVLSSESGQHKVYAQTLAHHIENEEDLTVLSCGTMGSGKTFTLIGEDEQPGIIPRAIEHLFRLYADGINLMPMMKLKNGHIALLEDGEALRETQLQKRLLNEYFSVEEKLKHINWQNLIRMEHNFVGKGGAATEAVVNVWVSFVEIYNECVYDLLEAQQPPPTLPFQTLPQRKQLKIACNRGEVFIKGLRSVYVSNSSEAMHLLHYGLQRVKQYDLRRSHCVFYVDVLKFQANGVTSKISYKFCDLAGSERRQVKLARVTRINTSLLVLGRCLNAANGGNIRKTAKDLIPYRESKLTMLLQSALQGKEKLIMIANITPSDECLEENLSVLNFAASARNVVYKKAGILRHKQKRYSALMSCSNGNAECNGSSENEELFQELLFLRAELERMRAEGQLALHLQESNLRNNLCDHFERIIAVKKKQYEIDLSLEIEELQRKHVQKIAIMKREHQQRLEDKREEAEKKLIELSVTV